MVVPFSAAHMTLSHVLKLAFVLLYNSEYSFLWRLMDGVVLFYGLVRIMTIKLPKRLKTMSEFSCFF